MTKTERTVVAVLVLALIIAVMALSSATLLPETRGHNIYKQEKMRLKAKRKERFN